jgi:hypothetical protein
MPYGSDMTSEQLAQLALDLNRFKCEHVDPVDNSTRLALDKLRSDIVAEMNKQRTLGN